MMFEDLVSRQRGHDRPESIFQLMRSLAKMGYGPAEFEVARMYSSGAGVSRNVSRALYWYRRSAQHGVVEAAYNLGLYYEKGLGGAKNIALAATWYRAAAEHGDSDAEVALGNLVEDYLTCDNESAYAKVILYWYRRAARHGNRDGIFNLGLCYRFGAGVRPNSRKSRELLTKAAALGHRRAQNMLSREGAEKRE
jgi:hypothetical protein